MTFYFRWKGFVEESIKWNVRLYHENIVGKDETWIDSVISSKRKIKQVNLINSLNIRENKTMEIFKYHGNHIRKFFIFGCVFEEADLFVELLNTMPKLEKVIISETGIATVDDDFKDNSKLPELKELTTIEINQSEYEILAAFKKSKISTLKVLHGSAYHNPEAKQLQSLRYFTDFLSTQQNIETMALRSIDYEEHHMFSAPLPVECIRFRLKRLSLLGMNLRDAPNEYNNLVKFLKQANLEELELGRKFPEFIYEFIFSKFKNLTTFRVMGSDIPREMSFYERLEENRSIRNFVLVDSCKDSRPLVELVKHMPNIQSLTLVEDCEREALEAIAGSLNQLNHLSIAHCDPGRFNGLRFQSAHFSSLCIKYLDQPIDWDDFTRFNPGVKHLKIQTMFDSTSADFEAITSNWKLETMILHNDVDCDENFFNIIRNNCLHLNTLELNIEDISVNASDVTDIRALQFKSDELSISFCHVESVFWQDSDYEGGLPSDDYNWSGEAFDPENMDSFEVDEMMEDMMHDLGIYESDNDYDSYDDDYD